MKKVLIPVVVVAAALLAFAEPKVFNIKMTEVDVAKHWDNLSAVQQIIDQSSIPHDKAKFCLESIEALKKQIEKQVLEQANAKADTTDQKKKK